MNDAEFYELTDYLYEESVDAKLTAAENLRQVVDRGGYIDGTDALYAGWITGIEPDSTGRTELTDELHQLLAQGNIKIMEENND